MSGEKKETEDKKTNLAVEPPSEDNDEKLFSDEVFRDNLDFEDDLENLPL